MERVTQGFAVQAMSEEDTVGVLVGEVLRKEGNGARRPVGTVASNENGARALFFGEEQDGLDVHRDVGRGSRHNRLGRKGSIVDSLVIQRNTLLLMTRPIPM